MGITTQSRPKRYEIYNYKGKSVVVCTCECEERRKRIDKIKINTN